MTTFDLNRYFADLDGEVADAQLWLDQYTHEEGDVLTIVHGDGKERTFKAQRDERGELQFVEVV